MILPADAPVGKPFGEYLGRSGGDVVYDLEVTPNRPDLNSVIGIAREIAAVTGNPLRIPDIDNSSSTICQPSPPSDWLRSASKTRSFAHVTRRASSKA